MVTKTGERTKRLTMLALLAALVAVLQIICTFIKFGPFSITLALTPIIVGAALFGWRAGALLGFVFSLVVYITGLMGLDGGFVLLMMDYSAIGTTVLCLLKGTAAGAVAGLVYAPLEKQSPLGATLAASALTPIVNTGLFALGIYTIFYGFLAGMTAEGESPLALLLLGWIGVNFLVELAVNMVLGTAVTRIIAVYRKSYGGKRA